MKQEVEAVVEEAVQFALASPQPTLEDAARHFKCNRHEALI